MSDLIIRHLNKSFEGRKVLNDFNAVFPEGSTTCIMGVSGCGKTTLLRLMCSLIKPDSGSIEGVPQKIAYVFQEDRLCESFSAIANIRLVSGNTLSEETIRSHFKELGLEKEADQPVSKLSGGMKRRVAIARAICYAGDLLLLDEPFKGLDEKCRRDTIAYLRSHTKGKIVICVTHEPEDAELLEAAVIRMDKNEFR